MALRRSRTKCPTQLTTDVVLACLTGANLEQRIPALQQGKNLFEYNHTLKTIDRDAIYMYKDLLKALLLSNSTGVMKKSVVQDALKAWSDQHQEILTKNRVPHFLSTEAYTLVHMVQCIK